ncbi:hypothetical protein [Bacillus sp. S10(2024)]|uniref:hypothetical protein n=1 Tax=Bacillus sp. S10(2024) TaxID=3162886 RepID=UPI003D1DBC37
MQNKTKHDRYLLVLFLTLHVAEKGPDRFYTRPDALARIKRRRVFMLFFKFVFIPLFVGSNTPTSKFGESIVQLH